MSVFAAPEIPNSADTRPRTDDELGRRRPPALVLALALACVGCGRHLGSPGAPVEEPGPALPLHRALTFEARNTGCRGFPLASLRGEASLDVDRDHEAVLELLARPDDPPITGLVGVDGSALADPEPHLCRWGGPVQVRGEGFTGRLLPTVVDERCGGALDLECRPERLTLPDRSGAAGPADVLVCTVGEPAPTALWVILAGDAMLLGAGALRSEIDLQGLGGARQRLTRGP